MLEFPPLPRTEVPLPPRRAQHHLPQLRDVGHQHPTTLTSPGAHLRSFPLHVDKLNEQIHAQMQEFPLLDSPLFKSYSIHLAYLPTYQSTEIGT